MNYQRCTVPGQPGPPVLRSLWCCPCGRVDEFDTVEIDFGRLRAFGEPVAEEVGFFRLCEVQQNTIALLVDFQFLDGFSVCIEKLDPSFHQENVFVGLV